MTLGGRLRYSDTLGPCPGAARTSNIRVLASRSDGATPAEGNHGTSQPLRWCRQSEPFHTLTWPGSASYTVIFGLPLSHSAQARPVVPPVGAWNHTLEPLTGVEPALPPWKGGVLPLHHSGVFPGMIGAHTRKLGGIMDGSCSLTLWSSWSDSNRRPAGYKSAALPLSYRSIKRAGCVIGTPSTSRLSGPSEEKGEKECFPLSRVVEIVGIEPATSCLQGRRSPI